MNTRMEPVMVRALIAALAQGLALVGVAVSAEDVDTLVALILALLPVATIVQGYLARKKVSPVEPPHDDSLRV